MKKQDLAIVVLLSALLLAWLFYQNRETARLTAQQAAERAAAAASATNTLSSAAVASAVLQPQAAPTAPTAPVADPAVEAASDLPATEIQLVSEELRLTVSSKGATLRNATLLEPHYRATLAADSGPLRLDFDPQPALALLGLPGLGVQADFTILSNDAHQVVLQRATGGDLTLERRIALLPDYRIEVTDRFLNTGAAPLTLGSNQVVLGSIHRADSPNEMLACDSLASGRTPKGGEWKVRHWETELPRLFTGGGRGFGCGGGPAAEGLPLRVQSEALGAQQWLALKSRFFVQVFSSDATNTGFRLDIARHAKPGKLQLAHASAQVCFAGDTLAPGASLARQQTLYVGPKKLALLNKLGPRRAEIMQFGFFKWVCVLLVPILNFFHQIIPNYGVAVILLTLLVRVIFWPLTHKSTESMKRMQALQPQLKALQEKFKSEPQKMQQETWKLYRENKTNPLASCLPTLVQIPVFIALYTVLRSAVELRFASFLWVRDLSEPENLLPGLIFGYSLNILPVLMSATMVLQSKFTPSMGDPAQQKMMMWMMPIMMLFMFYNMPAALVLYWTVSQGISIAQLAWQRSHVTPIGAPPAAGGTATSTEGLTRQQRRRLTR